VPRVGELVESPAGPYHTHCVAISLPFPPMSETLRGPAVARGVSRLAFDAVEQLTRIVEAMHANIASSPLRFRGDARSRTRGLTGFVYESIRVVNAGARAALDFALERLPYRPREDSDALLAVLNGVVGDHLARSGNPLAIPMQLRRDEGRPGPRLLLLVHGLCMGDRGWTRNGHDHGEALARELGFTPVYVRYNSGRRIADNGRELAALLESLLAEHDGAELTILAHSMGGLVTRSACRHAEASGHAWPMRLSKLVFLGTPHRGAPLERGGSWLETLLGVSKYTSPLGRLGMLRSDGIRDLRHGTLGEGDCAEAERLPAGVECHALAGARDALVPVDSALGFPDAQNWIGARVGHLDLLDDAEVYARLREILSPPGSGA
jgi:pimeloyl-ACP methyl ester carboxylesterase